MHTPAWYPFLCYVTSLSHFILYLFIFSSALKMFLIILLNGGCSNNDFTKYQYHNSNTITLCDFHLLGIFVLFNTPLSLTKTNINFIFCWIQFSMPICGRIQIIICYFMFHFRKWFYYFGYLCGIEIEMELLIEHAL